MNSFDSLFQSLNPEQKQAVEQLEGPVMVIAGPGTGKTQILATRILNILEKESIPENILCLTYTDAGATAMQQRLATFMGSDAYKVNIFTFHGLCNKIIKDFPDKFGKREMRVMDDLERIDILQQIIEEIHEDSPLKSYSDSDTTLIGNLRKTWNLMESEGYNVDTFKLWIDILNDDEMFKLQFPKMVYQKKYKEFNAGDIKANLRKPLQDNWKKLIEASKLLDRYNSLKKELGVYEFSDMLNWVNEKLKTDQELLSIVQEKYQYVLVDEYQDTSGIQNEILYSLIEYWEDNPNCFVVGDDDQSIYAFQGAKVSNMLGFKEKYAKNLTTIVLTKNYRSSQSILDDSVKLISKNKSRLVNTIEGLSKDLISSGANKDFPNLETEIIQYQNEFHESVGIVDRIELQLNEGIVPKEIAVLYSQHKHSQTIIELFQEKNIPFVLNRAINILQEPIVKQLIQWMTYLSYEASLPNSGEYLIYQLLLSDRYAISTFTLNQISVEIYQIKRKKEYHNESYSWREHFSKILKSPDAEEIYGKESYDAIKALWDNVEKWIKIATVENVPTLIQRIYSEGGFLAHALKQDDTGWSMEILHSFMEFAVQQNNRIPFISLKEMISMFQKMEKSDIPLFLEKRIGNSSGVQLLTAHGSKGLEFEHVYILRGNDTVWEKDEGMKLPYNIRQLILGNNKVIESESSVSDSFEERRRLFYVAMTRAKKQLIISYCKYKIASKVSDSLASTFVLDIAKENQIPKEPMEIPMEKLLWAQQKCLERTSKPILEIDKKDWLKSKVENLIFSPTSIETLMSCGVEFYFSRILRVPSAPNQYGAFGTAIHAALREFVVKGVNAKKWMSQPELVKHFEYEMMKVRAGFTQKQFELRLDQGRSILPKYHTQKIQQYEKYEKIETEFSISTKIEGISITGNLDKMVFEGNDITVYDYKTSKLKNTETKSKIPSKQNIEKGNFPPSYWFQLGLYTMMINESFKDKNWKSRNGVIESLISNDDGVFQDFPIIYSNDDFDLIKSWVLKANEKLQSLNFMEGCNKCEWCQFAKESGQVIYVPNNDSSESTEE